MNSYRYLAVADPADLLFSTEPKPLTTKRDLTIGGGLAYPELKFTLPTMFLALPEAKKRLFVLDVGVSAVTARAV